MLSICPIKSVAKAVAYFQGQDNYYVKEGEEFQGVWGGKGAKLLGLAGEVKSPDFVAVLAGRLSPEITMPSTTNKRRLAYDLTFSAPKSVSILALIGKDERVLAAHRVAVNAALTDLEQNYAATRIKAKGRTTIEKTDNLLFARFEHIESRELDPDLHTHSVLMNATCRSDQQWRTLYFDQAYEDQKLLGVIYRGKLVQELMKAGFEITQTSAQGFFELKGFAESLIKQFSKRREQIEKELEKEGLASAKAAQIANFNTRKDKQKINLKELEAKWVAQLPQCGIDLAWLQDYSAKAIARGPVTPANPYQLAHQALQAAIRDLSKWQPTFSTKKLLKIARGLSISNFSPMLLEKALAEQFKTGQLWYLKDDICTTQANRDLEIANVLNMRQGKNKVVPMFTNMAAVYVAAKITDKLELRLILKQLLTNTDRQIVCSAKTTVIYATAMQLLVKLADQYGFYPIGITQTVNRIEPFTKELGLTRTQTIAGFLMSCSNRAEKLKCPIAPYKLANARQIWILDLAGGIPVVDVNALQQYAKQFGTRIIWGYDPERPQAAINALIQHGIKQCNLEHNSSMKNLSALMTHPKLHIINNAVDMHDWQANTASTLIHWLAVKYQERHAVFGLKDLQLELFSLGLTVPKEVLKAQLDLALQQGSLIKLVDQLITTKDTVLLEQACLELTIKNQETEKSIMELAAIKLPDKLTAGQQQAIKLILTTKDRVIGIQGIAGAGKTTMLRTLNQLCIAAGFEIIGLATATSARERLQDGSKNIASYDALLRSGIKVFTTRKFLINSEKLLNIDPTLAHLEYGGNKLFVLDEASFVSTAEMFAVVTKMEQLQVKLIVMGDYKQLPSVEAGRIFYLMLGSNMKSVVMKENVRFKSANTLTVMQHIYNNQIPQALEQLGTAIIEIADHKERLITMAKLYLAKTPEEQANTILITPEHVDRKIVNHEIRQGLKANGQLKGAEINCHNLTEIKLTKAEKQNIYYFKEQDWLCFSKTNTKIQPYNYYQIKVKNLEDRTLVLEHVKEQIIWSPERQPGVFNIYRQEARSLMAQDQIRWLKNNELKGICNGQSAIVLAIKDNDEVEVKLQNGNLIVLDLKQLEHQHWDHAYAATAFVAQGADKPSTIALAKGGYVQEIMAKDIEIDKVIMVLEESTATTKDLPKSKWVKVLAITNDHIATVQDRTNATVTIDLKKSPTNLEVKGQAIWYSYADPKVRKKCEIPKLTSNEEFLVSVTRGDNVTVLVDHLESYQHTLEQKLSGTRSALEFLAPNRAEVKAKVQNMIRNITSIKNVVNKEDGNQKKTSSERHSLYKNANLVTTEQVINKLNANILQYTTNWLGRPHKISSLEARWGKKGSLVVKLSGAKIGYWHDFEVGKGGKNLLSLYMDCFNSDFKTAMASLSKELNIYNETRLFKQELAPRKNASSKQEQKLALLTMKKIKYAKELYAKGTTISGTLAEKYLREFRGITGTIPDDFRFCAKLKHPDLGRMVPALLAPIKNAQNEIQGIVRIFLNSEGNKLNATYVDNRGNKLPATVKANLGSMHNAAVIIKQAKFPGTVYIAEGIETALSIAQTKPLDTVIAALSVSNLKNIPLPCDTQKIILCADHDGPNATANKALVNAAKSYLERGLAVAIAYPATIKDLAKVDFNDVLKILGVNSIARSLQQAIPQILSNVTNTIEATEIKHLPTNIIENNTKELNR